jgi:hypothetical protein
MRNLVRSDTASDRNFGSYSVKAESHEGVPKIVVT